MKGDDLGDRMKGYEAAETSRVFDPDLPLVVRLDGRAFSTFTRGMGKPFDADLSEVMRRVTETLIEETHARIGYTQSDEITLIFARYSEESQPLFGGKLFKIQSVLAGMASARFALLAARYWPERVAKMIPHFDCRAFAVPSRTEAVNALIWREADAMRNAIQAVAQLRFSPKQMHGRPCSELETMLADIGVTMDQFPAANRFGTYQARRTFQTNLSAEELARIPEAHRPTGPVIRSRVETLDIAPLVKRADREALIFAPSPTQTPEPSGGEGGR